MRKLAIGILLFLYVFTQVGSIAWYYFEPVLHAVCYNHFQVFNSWGGHSTLLTMDTSDFEMAKQEDNEILWKGELYDIRSIQIQGCSMQVLAEKDLTETKLVQLYENVKEQIRKSQSSQPPQGNAIFEWVAKLYKPAIPFMIPPSAVSIRPDFNVYTNNLLLAFSVEGPLQPPEAIS